MRASKSIPNIEGFDVQVESILMNMYALHNQQFFSSAIDGCNSCWQTTSTCLNLQIQRDSHRLYLNMHSTKLVFSFWSSSFHYHVDIVSCRGMGIPTLGCTMLHYKPTIDGTAPSWFIEAPTKLLMHLPCILTAEYLYMIAPGFVMTSQSSHLFPNVLKDSGAGGGWLSV